MLSNPERAGRLLADAWRSGRKIAGLGDFRPQSRQEAYSAQQAMAAELGLPIGGWKVGAATPAILAQRGLDAPIPGPIYETHVFKSPCRLPGSEFAGAFLESEFAFRTTARLPPRSRPYATAELAETAALHAAFDVTQSRFAETPDALSEIADSGNSGAAVIGLPIRDWRTANLGKAAVALRLNGGRSVHAYSGQWRRDPLDVFWWLVNSLRRRAIGLEAGAYVLTGAVTEPQPLAPGSSAVARFEGGGEVRVQVGKL